MLKITVEQEDVKVDERTVGDRTIRTQRVYTHSSRSKYPEAGKVGIKAGQGPYPAGNYTLSPDSYQIGKYGDIEINRFEMQLLPYPTAAAAPVRKAS